MKALCVYGLSILLSVSVAAAQRDANDLDGRVVDEGGEAIAGASIFIYTAAPREGYSPL